MTSLRLAIIQSPFVLKISPAILLMYLFAKKEIPADDDDDLFQRNHIFRCSVCYRMGSDDGIPGALYSAHVGK